MIIVKNLYKEYKLLKNIDKPLQLLKFMCTIMPRRWHFGTNKFQVSWWFIFKNIFNRKYEKKKVINNLSFYIDEGELIGFIGPNGAGKSTTLNMLTGILLPTSGIIRVNGMDPFENHMEYVKQIGTVFGHKTQLWEGMPIIDSFEMAKHMYKISDEEYEKNMQLLCNMLDLGDILYKQVSEVSLGQRMRADFAYAMIHNPKILYLDEPTIGLDIITKEKILNFIYEVNRLKKTTVIFVTHNIMDIEKICSRVMIIDNGTMIYDGGLKKVKEDFGLEFKIKLKVDKLPDFQDLPINKYEIEKDFISISYDNKVINSSTILKQLMRQTHIKDVKIFEPKLEDTIKKIYVTRGKENVVKKVN